MAVDYAHTRTARENREKKAQALAAAARRLGHGAEALSIGTGHRRTVWKGAELTHSPSEETWALAAQILRETLPPGEAGRRPQRGPQPQPCRYGDGRPGGLYLGGWLCREEHAPPPPPVPRPGTTLDDFRARAAARAAEEREQRRNKR